ncbi:L,D-transpeptidase [Legionella brunensis]|uniref:Enhanced entry protein EnhA n=1 Tax=Legionella brunensis TaxID=29422 RepID=A0A0W0S3S4_9GAMM|nr:L,D-transpeptidase [Legionella brunensis]KTC78231.1 enhanced entry protein EnhA [Legionella brunensis]
MEEVKARKYWPVTFLGLILFYFGAEKDLYATNLISQGPYLTLASNTFIFNPRSLTWKAVQNGKVIRTGKASGGSKYCHDIKRSCRTPSGTYSIISKGSASCRSSRYPLPNGGAKMPYCMFFSKYYAIHGSYDVPNYNASHGCIRVRPGDALWLHRNFIKIGTKVVVQPY